MEKKLGRPPKIEGVISYKDFKRAGIVTAVYDERRKDGEKHNVAVKEIVDFIKQHYPSMRISETTVRRILAEFRPRESHVILRFERSTLTGEDLTRWQCRIQERLAHLSQTNELAPPPASDISPRKSVTVYRFRFEERPNYPRHNRKLLKE